MQLALEQKIGQMLWFGWQGEPPDASLQISERPRTLLQEFLVGGIILMGRNLRDPRQVAELTTQLQAESQVPLFVGVDQEGGAVSRLTLPGLTFPGNMALGALDDPAAATAVTAAIGEQLAALGLNVDFAPVLDVNNNPANPVIGVRSFGEDPRRVAKLGLAALRGFQQAGVISCVKHFPGHGDTAVDSHRDLPIQRASRSRLDEIELLPFRAAIAAGAPLLMTAHILFPALDDRWPATLSRSILTDLLRSELGYDGVVVTDCLEMDGIARHFGVEEAALAAVEAGADCLLACHTLETQRRIHRALLDAARQGRLASERIDQSVQRILALKHVYALDERRSADPRVVEERVGAPRFVQLERELSERAVTVVSDTSHCLPILGGPVQVAGAPAIAAALVSALREVGIKADTRAEPPSGSAQTGILVVLPGQADREEGKALIRQWSERGLQVIMVAAREPYPLADYADAPCRIATYGEGAAAIEALARVLAGQARPEGRLPVSVVGGPDSSYNGLK
jgi:beta-N-acetylhexosaminidase